MKKITIIFIVLFCKIYATGNLNNFELDCGIYRELDTGTHWHAALFNLSNTLSTCLLVRPNSKSIFHKIKQKKGVVTPCN